MRPRTHLLIGCEYIAGSKTYTLKWGHNERATFQLDGTATATYWATMSDVPQEPDAQWSQVAVRDNGSGNTLTTQMANTIVQIESLCAAYIKVVVASGGHTVRLAAELDA